MNTNSSPTESPQETPASRGLVNTLYREGALSHGGRIATLDYLRPTDWRSLLGWIFFSTGLSMILCGVLYFFAFNWDKISPEFKLGGIQTAILLSIVGALTFKSQSLTGKAFLLSASFLVGIFLAVFGQIYQTGADAWQLFAGWSLLILGWTILSKFSAQWILWLTVTNIAISLWWLHSMGPQLGRTPIYLHLILAIFNGLALVIREYASIQLSLPWLQSRWTRYVILSLTIYHCLFAIMRELYSPYHVSEGLGYIGTLGLIACYVAYRWMKHDIWALAMTILALTLAAEVWFIDIIGLFINDIGWNGFLILAFLTLLLFSFSTFHLWSLVPTGDDHE